MKITKQNDYYLLKNDNGEYHLSIEDYEKLGKDKAIELATSEIEKKNKSNQYLQATIDFSRARELGFCGYGIKDFARMLDLDINKEYSILELRDRLTPDAFLEYPSECRTLFGKNVIEIFGGAKSFLENNKTENALNFILINDYLEDTILHELACDFAERTLHNFEKEYPNDKRPRLAIEAKRKYLKGEISEDELSAAESAAWSAARSEEIESQINIVLKYLK